MLLSTAPMRMLPPSLIPRTSQWRLAISLSVLADLGEMLAAFMPMKAILVLASESVPSFFPAPLVDAGAIAASLSLILAGAITGSTAWLTRRWVQKLDEGDRRHAQSQPATLSWNHQERLQALEQRKYVTSVALLLPVALVLALVSLPFLVISALWVVASAAWFLVKVRRSPRKATYESGVDQFSHELATWLRTSALWSVVLLAIVTLLLAPPVLGSAAILIAAIFGRRLFLALADSVPESIRQLSLYASRQAPSRTRLVIGNEPSGKAVQRPIEFLSSKVGQEQAQLELHRLGGGLANAQVLNADTPSPSLIASFSRGHQILIRIFAKRDKAERDREYHFRLIDPNSMFVPVHSLEMRDFAGLPAIAVNLESPDAIVKTSEGVSPLAAARFQVERELVASISNSDEGLSLRLNDDVIHERLLRISRLPGDHVDSSLRLLDRLPELRRCTERLPVVWIPSRALRPSDFYVSMSGTVTYIGGHTWSMGHPGDRWGPEHHFSAALQQLVYELELESIFPTNAVMLNYQLQELSLEISRFQVSRLKSRLDQVESALNTALLQ